MKNVNPCTVTLDGAPELDVLSVSIDEGLSRLTSVTVVALAPARAFTPRDLVGRAAVVELVLDGATRTYRGLCLLAEEVSIAERTDVATVRIRVGPPLAAARLRIDHRIFQRLSEPGVAIAILDAMGVPHRETFPTERFAAREMRVQYGETDLAFFSRMLESAGVAYLCVEEGVVLDDAPASRAPSPPLPFHDRPPRGVEAVSRVSLRRNLRPGRATVTDHDLRIRGAQMLGATTTLGAPVETALERHAFRPGAFLYEVQRPVVSTPWADDRGAFRTDEAAADALVARRVRAGREDARVLELVTTRYTVAPGDVLQIVGHPDPAIAADPWLVTDVRIFAPAAEDAVLEVRAVPASEPWHPPLTTPTPRVPGPQLATIVGRAGEEIDVDEFGRVRVQFRWDRVGTYDERSSCWVPVNQPWAGKGYGAINLPRIGQQVLVHFVCGHPDRPFLTGRVYSATQAVPYKLPASKNQSGWRSQSTGKSGGANEIRFDDTSYTESFGIRAQRDLHISVLGNSHTTVRGSRTVKVGGFDVQNILGGSFVRVGKARKTFSKGPWSLRADLVAQESGTVMGYKAEKGEVTFEGQYVRFFGKGTLAHIAKSLTLRVGGSVMIFDASGVKMQAPKVNINVTDPGPGVAPPDYPESVPLEMPEAKEGGGNSGKIGSGRVVVMRRSPTVRTDTIEGYRRTTRWTEAGTLGGLGEQLPGPVEPTTPRAFEEPDGQPDPFFGGTTPIGPKANASIVTLPTRPGLPARVDLSAALDAARQTSPLDELRRIGDDMASGDVPRVAQTLGVNEARLTRALEEMGGRGEGNPFARAARGAIGLARRLGLPIPAAIADLVADEGEPPAGPKGGGRG